MTTFGAHLKAWRKEADWTLKDLSLMSNLSVSYLSDMERERTLPAIPTLVKLADAFDVTVALLLVGVDFGERKRHNVPVE
jgi:transcriptional regulator with XRE-family HTH domain